MTQPARAQEPSMEEILASIRRIIADDDATKSNPSGADAAKAVAPAPRPVPPPPRMSVTPLPPAPAAELDSAALAAPSPEADSDADDQSADILELTESMAAPPPAPAPEPRAAPGPPQFRTIDGASDVGFDDGVDRAAPRAHGEPDAHLISPSTKSAVDSAFNTLAQTVLVQNARTLEDLVREMLRPMLKSWLDENLPSLVERLVRAEIERVSRGH
jgi:uncharacterized protein